MHFYVVQCRIVSRYVLYTSTSTETFIVPCLGMCGPCSSYPHHPPHSTTPAKQRHGLGLATTPPSTIRISVHRNSKPQLFLSIDQFNIHSPTYLIQHERFTEKCLEGQNGHACSRSLPRRGGRGNRQLQRPRRACTRR